jgi:deazaflavin-dependent oxidoreductase (nitroreductase family)
VIEQFRTNGGSVQGWPPLLLLHHTGAKSGTERVTPLVYQQLDDGNVAIFASKAGAPKHPDWFHNLVAHPDVKIEIGDETRRVHARVAEGDERERIWTRQKEWLANFAEYEQKAGGRTIPVIVLEHQ